MVSDSPSVLLLAEQHERCSDFPCDFATTGDELEVIPQQQSGPANVLIRKAIRMGSAILCFIV